MIEEYELFYRDGPTKVQVVISDVRTGCWNGDSGNLQLEGILSGETEHNLVFDSLRPLNINTQNRYMKGFDSSRAFLRKKQIALLYVV